MSNPKTPTYDKSHYSWQAPSSQASQYIIEHDDPASPGTSTSAGVRTSYFDPKQVAQQPGAPAEPQVESAPGLIRRSTFNYEHESEEYKKSLLEQDDGTGDDGAATAAAEDAGQTAADAAPRRGSISSQPFKPRAKRTQSWDYRDKRGEMQMTMLHDAGTPKDGFSESWLDDLKPGARLSSDS